MVRFAAQQFSAIDFHVVSVRNVLLVSTALTVPEYPVDRVSLVKLAQLVRIARTALVCLAVTVKAVARHSAN